jgi:hypothetical protein
MHYMCWHKEDWNYHPSMPMKRLQQVQDIVDMNGNVLLWSCLGSAAIGLQYLDQEANEAIPPRLRFYGQLNDSEFCAECGKRDITAFAVIWKAQLWEFPAEFSEDESELLALNKLRGAGKPGWVGMSELSTDRYPRIFDPIGKYFPDGLINSDGDVVKDFLEEFRVVTLDGKNVLSTWLMVPGHDHYCYTPCGNNPTFMQYLRKEIEMMVDAGAQGILVDEFDAQLHGLFNAGCFCKDCMKGFRAYLRENPSDETAGLDLEQFDYREFLKERGYADNDLLGAQGERRMSIPLFRQFVTFNLRGAEQNVADIGAYAREYSLEKRGEPILVTANLFNCLPHSARIRQYCDLIAGEKSNIKLRQDGFYRFGYAFLQGKDGSFIEDPNQHILQIIEDIKSCKNDAYILFMMEPLAHGFNGAIPYGAWLMNLEKDSFYPDMDVEREMGRWLKRHEHLFTPAPVADVAMIYDLRSALETEMFLGGHLDKEREGGFRTFHDLAQWLCEEHVLYNVIYVSDDQPLTPDRLQGYKKVLIPDAFSLRPDEVGVIRDWAGAGGQAAAVGKVVKELAGFRFTYRKPGELLAWLKNGEQIVEAEGSREIGFGLHKRENGYTLHLVNYKLNSITREIESIPRMSFKLSWAPNEVQVYSFPERGTEAAVEDNVLTISNLSIYTVVDLQ